MTRQLFSYALIALLCANISAFAQKSCCAPAENATWGALAMNADFRDAHLAPEPFSYSPTVANAAMIKFETKQADMPGNAWYLPSDQPTDNVLIVFHEWWGLNDYIKQEAENWQKILGNVDVYAVDLYDGKVADSPALAQKLSSSLDQKRGEAIVSGLLSHIGNNKRIVTLGWCMGGAWAFTAGLMAGNQTAGVVMYYGFPEKDTKKIATLKSDVLYIYGSQDKFIQKSMVDNFQKDVEATGHKFTLHTFDAVHAFANPSNPKHDKLATKQAEQFSEKFIKQKMQLN